MTRCLRCMANVTNLSLIPVIEKHRSANRIQSVWEMSTFGATLAYLRRTTPRVTSSEYFPGRPSGELINGIRNEDVQSQSFADDSLDLITSNQVFEHVENDMRGYSECFRTLRPGGALIFSVPLYDIPETRQLASRTEHGIEYYGTPEYHDSRSGGPGSELCFWRHSIHDIVERVSSAGFRTTLEEVRIPPALPESTLVVYAVKSAEIDSVRLATSVEDRDQIG